MRVNGGERARLRDLAAAAKADGDVQPEGVTEATGAISLAPDLAAHRRRDAVEQSKESGWVRKLVFFCVGCSMA